MFTKRLSWWRRILRRKSLLPSPQIYLIGEELETRWLPATYLWLPTDWQGLPSQYWWDTPNNWQVKTATGWSDTTEVPGAGDTAMFDSSVPGTSNWDCWVNAGVSVANITIQSNYSGFINLAGSLNVSGTFNMSGVYGATPALTVMLNGTAGPNSILNLKSGSTFNWSNLSAR